MKIWTQTERIALRTYLAQHPNFEKAVRDAMTKPEGKTVEEAALTGMKRAGQEELLGIITGQLCWDESKSSDDAGFIPNES